MDKLHEPNTTYTEEFILLNEGFPIASLGTRVVKVHHDYWLRSHIYLCPKCGDIWGKRLITKHNNDHSFEALSRFCSIHGDGSFLLEDWQHQSKEDNLPSELLLYELAAAVDRYKPKEQEDE